MKLIRTANNKKKITISKREWESIGKQAGWMSKKDYSRMDEPIIPKAISILSSNPDAIQFNDKASFDNYLKSQKYFSASYSHCYYSEEDLESSRRGDAEFRDGAKGISEADRGCVMLFDAGHELVAIWDERNSIGFILPKSI